ncbi:hypothetical protein Q763_16615 [Flavobacterium beibuense F44-8]|uniref:Uncharacterized protein n=1 Tax=Flavobacterium beibuense F44-8 TaxID=1406840 RepID=A0A0A2LG07_9FLAO|nr:hypothetical protein [Flavobacterium beibuense]KGO78809.1 hypothetical protein Q763_16615 [Flavobacterium beibuense F44-8]
MESYTKEQLIEKGLDYTVIKGETYFPLADIFKEFPEAILKTNTSALARDFKKEFKLSIRADDFYVMSDFDKKILKTLNFNPKNK